MHRQAQEVYQQDSFPSLPLLGLTLMNGRDYRTDCRLASSQNECNQTQRLRGHRGNFTLYKMEAGGNRTDSVSLCTLWKTTEIQRGISHVTPLVDVLEILCNHTWWWLILCGTTETTEGLDQYLSVLTSQRKVEPLCLLQTLFCW